MHINPHPAQKDEIKGKMEQLGKIRAQLAEIDNSLLILEVDDAITTLNYMWDLLGESDGES